MTTPSVPADTNTPSPAQALPEGDINAFMAGPMPVPSDAERQGAMAAPVAPPLETPVQQPHIEEPTPIQPNIEQPAPTQPAPAQPQSVTPQPTQPTPADLQKQINDLTTQAQERETAYETQRTETEAQQQQAQTQQIQTGAQQYGMQQYQKYLAAGTTEEMAKQWATNDAQFAYQAYGASLQANQATTRAQTTAKQYGINPQDLQNIDPASMDAHARLLQRLSRVETGTQSVQTNQIAQQRFDSGVGAAPGNATEQFIKTLGDPGKAATPQQLQLMEQYMRQLNPNI